MIYPMNTWKYYSYNVQYDITSFSPVDNPSSLMHALHAESIPLISCVHTSGVATPGSTRAQALIKYVCVLVKLLNGQHWRL